MKIQKKSIGGVLIVVGCALLIIGVYYLGRHNGLETIRKGDSGLGGLLELGSSWIQIIGGVSAIGIGILMQSQPKEGKEQ